LFVRHWDQWSDGRRSHLFVQPLLRPGEPVDVCGALDADVPSRPFGGSEEYAFTPDGDAIVFTAREAGKTEAWSTDFDLYVSPLDGSQPPRNLTPENEAWDSHPRFSPDGKTLAYLAMDRPGYEADRFSIVLRQWPPSPGAQDRRLAPDWDRSVQEMAFSHDGKSLWVTAEEAGQRPLFGIDTASGAVRRLVASGTVRFPLAGAGRIYYGLEHLASPLELFAVDAAGSRRQQLTALNRERLAAVELGTVEELTFAGFDDEPVHGLVVHPVGLAAGERAPVALLIHGGPQGSFGNDFHYRWNPQVYAGSGLGVVMINFHGSTGYGQAFTDSIRGDWGGKPLVDLQRGLAAAIEKFTFLDGERVCALGASYGGYMVNWIAGVWPDRFRCLVSHDGIFDQRTMYYATEELWFPEWEFSGPHFESPTAYEQHNPVLHVEEWRTPLMVIHGAADYRVPDTQGIAAFTAAQRRGVPARLLHFPDENHWVLKPRNSVQWHHEVLRWLDQWLRGDG
jgi:dipeptidyl aminopeptidase/acylaminoacyl peptidase